MSVNKEGQIVQSPYRYGHIGDDAMSDEVDWDSLTFSLTPTDTMYITTTDIDSPWDIGELVPYGDMKMSPAAGVLNYGQGLFEGMKAYRTAEDNIVFFRPEENARRMQRGADRLKMPPVPESIFIDAVEKVVSANKKWIPPMGKSSRRSYGILCQRCRTAIGYFTCHSSNS